MKDRAGTPVPIERLLAHRAWVRRVAGALVAGEADAEDLAQEAWVRALERGPREEGAAKGWFRTVLRRGARDLWRAEERRGRREEAAARAEAGPSTEDLVAEAEILRRVVNAVLDLEEPYRTTVVLRYFHELTLKEVARRQGVPLETVRTRVRRALTLLRERFDEEEGGDRRRWMALLLPLARRGSHGPPIAAAGGSSLAAAAGVLAMTAKAKVAVGAVVVLLGVGIWASGRGGAPREIPGRDGRDVAVLPVAPETTEGPASVAEEADAVPGAPPRSAHLRGRVGGFLEVPGGFEVTLSVDRDGRPIARGTEEAGAFSVSYERDPPDAAAFRLTVSGPGLKPQVYGLPAAECDLGKIRLLQGILYGGRVEDAEGRPVPGVEVAFLWDYNLLGRSDPTGPDGKFAIPLAVETSLPSVSGGSVLPLMRGRAMDAVPAEAAGYRGEHLLRVRPREGGRIRLVGARSREPLVGWEVRLASVLGQGATTDPVHRVFDSGVTDAAGLFEPLWATGESKVSLEARHGTRRVELPLDCEAAKAAGTLDIPIPPEGEAAVVAVRVLKPDGRTPAADAALQVGWRFGREGPGSWVRGRSDSRGEFVREVATAGESPGASPVVSWARVLYLDEEGRPVMEEVPVADPRSGIPVSRENPLVVRLGGARSCEVTWFRVRQAGTGRDLAPTRLYSAVGAGLRSSYLFTGSALVDRSGHRLWPAFRIPWQGWTPEQSLESIRFEVLVEGRAPRWFEVPVEEFVRARTASEPILLEFPPSDGDAIEVLVVPSDGRPRAGVLATLVRIPPGQPDGWWEKAGQCSTDAEGVSRFVLADPDGRFGIVAHDPGTGEAGAVPAPLSREATLRMEAPRTLSFRVTLPDGSVPRDATARLEDPRFVLPPVAAVATEDGRFEFPGVVPALYDLKVVGRGPSRPVSELPPGIFPGGGGEPALPGSDPGSPRATTLHGATIPAAEAGPVLVLR